MLITLLTVCCFTLKNYKLVFRNEYYGGGVADVERKKNSNVLGAIYKISKSEYSIYNDEIKFDRYDWIIDGIFGVGLSRDLNYKYQKIIRHSADTTYRVGCRHPPKVT